MAPGPGTDLLPADLLARLERLQLGTRRRLAGHLSGGHRSPRHGTSLDFADYRQYHPGDDFRRIDYHLLARLDVLVLKLFEAEDDLSLRLLIDTSASMGSGGKLRQAARLAAALGFVALVRRDTVTVHTFPLERPAPRFSGRAASAHLFAHLAGLEASGETRFAQAASHVLARRGPAGLTVVLSDLLTPEWEQALARLPARGGDLAVIQVLDPVELHPTLAGDLELVDRESGERVQVSLSTEARRDYERAARAWVEEVAGRVHQVGGSYLRVMAGDDPGQVLLGAGRREGVLG